MMRHQERRHQEVGAQPRATTATAAPWLQPHSGSAEQRNAARVFFGISLPAFLALAISGAAISWEGSNYLFQTLQSQTPIAPHDRYLDVLMDLPVLLFSHVSGNPYAWQVVFGLTHILVPITGLAVSWWILRANAPVLFVWVALMYGFVTVFGQMYLQNEEFAAIELCLPIVLAMVTRDRLIHVPVLAALALGAFFANPLSIPLFGFAAVLAAAIGGLHPEVRWAKWTWAGVLALLTVLNAIFFVVSSSKDSYNRQMLAVQPLLHSFRASVLGLPLLALLCVYAVLLFICAAPFARRFRRPRLMSLIYALEFVGLAVASVLVTLWAAAPTLWAYSDNYRLMAIFTILPLLGVIAFEGLCYGPDYADMLRPDRRHRLIVTQWAAMIMLVALGTQSVMWFAGERRLASALAASRSPCLSASSMEWLQGSFLDFDYLPALSLVLQGPTPHTIVLNGADCANSQFGADSANPENPLTVGGSGFTLAPLRQRLTAEQTAPSQCWFAVADGWWPPNLDSGPGVWYWLSGSGPGIVRVYAAHSGTATLRGQWSSQPYPNTLTITVNRVKTATRAATPDARASVTYLTVIHSQPFVITAVQLHQGENDIRFTESGPTVQRGAQTFSITVSSLSLTFTTSGSHSQGSHTQVCALHP